MKNPGQDKAHLEILVDPRTKRTRPRRKRKEPSGTSVYPEERGRSKEKFRLRGKATFTSLAETEGDLQGRRSRKKFLQLFCSPNSCCCCCVLRIEQRVLGVAIFQYVIS